MFSVSLRVGAASASAHGVLEGRSLEAGPGLFRAQRKEPLRNEASGVLCSVKGGVVFPGTFHAYYRGEGSGRTFSLRINSPRSEYKALLHRLGHAQLLLCAIKT